jgi:quercetin dioxygenase-like cupin family protein
MTRTDLQQLLNDAGPLPRTTSLVRETGLRAMLLHLREGEEIPEHQNRGAITVQCLQGHVIFFAGEERVELTPGLLISLPPELRHKLSGEANSLLLVTMSEPIRADENRNAA